MTNSTNNKIFDTVKEAYSELRRAKGLLDDIIGSLQDCLNSECEPNLTESIGIYVKQMPDFKFLSSEQLETDLRMVCTGEIDISEALNIVKEVSIMVVEAMNCFNADVIYPDETTSECEDCADTEGCCSNCNCNGNREHDHVCECAPNDECDCKCSIEFDNEDASSEGGSEDDYEELVLYIGGTKKAVSKAVKRIFK